MLEKDYSPPFIKAEIGELADTGIVSKAPHRVKQRFETLSTGNYCLKTQFPSKYLFSNSYALRLRTEKAKPSFVFGAFLKRNFFFLYSAKFFGQSKASEI
jgi:hypothetical protein